MPAAATPCRTEHSILWHIGLEMINLTNKKRKETSQMMAPSTLNSRPGSQRVIPKDGTNNGEYLMHSPSEHREERVDLSYRYCYFAEYCTSSQSQGDYGVGA